MTFGCTRELGRFTAAKFIKQFRQLLQAVCGHVAELTLVQVVDGLIQLFEELQSIRGDARLDDAAIVLLALAGDPTVLFHPIKHAGHVRVMGDHSFGNTTTEESVGFGAAEDAEHIVLGAGQASGFEELLGLLGEGIGGFEDGDEEVVRQGDRGGPAIHGVIIVVITIGVKR
jgi:hypothetical protein